MIICQTACWVTFKISTTLVSVQKLFIWQNASPNNFLVIFDDSTRVSSTIGGFALTSQLKCVRKDSTFRQKALSWGWLHSLSSEFWLTASMRKLRVARITGWPRYSYFVCERAKRVTASQPPCVPWPPVESRRYMAGLCGFDVTIALSPGTCNGSFQDIPIDPERSLTVCCYNSWRLYSHTPLFLSSSKTQHFKYESAR